MSNLEGFTLGHDAIQNAADGTIYFHYPCFDGLISAVLTAELHRQPRRWQRIQFCPVSYDDRKNWLSRVLESPCAVVDFLYHPKASFWADHHGTTFLNDDLRMELEMRKGDRWLLFDDQAPSCASLLWRNFARFLDDRFSEFVFWADKIDSARYDSVREAIFGDAPAVQINSSLTLGETSEYCRLLLEALRSNDLRQVAELPEVQNRYLEVTSRRAAGLKRMENRVHLEDGNIVTFDIQASANDIVSRYAPYHFFENARYSIGVVRLEDTIRITAMRNPWLHFESIPLGRIFEQFGGGGHQRVASVILSLDQAQRIPQILEDVRRAMRRQLAERVVA
jgi:hypothetical protein